MQPTALIRHLALPTAATLLLAACGTGGGAISPGPSPSPGAGTVSVRVVDNRGAPLPASGFAYQDGDGAWRALNPGQSTYTFNVSNSRYGFAARCPRFASESMMNIELIALYQFSVSDGTSWSVECAEDPSARTASYQVQYDASALQPSSVCLRDSLIGLASGAGCNTASTGTISPQNRRPGRQDLLLEVYAGASKVAVKVLPNVDVPQGSPYQITVTNSDRLVPNGGEVRWSGATSSIEAAAVDYISALGSRAILASALPNGGRFPLLPDLAGGSYLVGAGSWQYSGGSPKLGQEHFKLGTATTYNLLLPPVFTGASASLTPRPQFSGLSYAGFGTFPDLSLRAYVMFVGEPVGGQQAATWWQALATPSWLGSNTTYTFPDLSALTGFSGLQPPSSDRGTWSVAAAAVRPVIGQSLAWARSFVSLLGSRAAVRSQRVYGSQQIGSVAGVSEGVVATVFGP